jgi:alanine racemase
MQHSYTQLAISLGQYRRNVDAIRAAFGTKLMLILKANAYGMGAVGLLPVISEMKDIVIGVAVVDEALELRQADYLGNILVMGYTPPDQFKLALRHFLSLGIYRAEDISKLEDAAAELGTIARAHIKLDTGMRRVGATKESLPELLERISENPHVAVEGVYSHLAGSADPSDPIIPQQAKLFAELAGQIESKLSVFATKHLANSTGALAFPESRFDMVRIGILAVGYYPASYKGARLEIKPVIRLTTQAIDSRRVPANTGVSYNHKYYTSEECTLITIPVGYADGIPYQFFPGGQVLFRGKRRDIAGVVNMDYMVINANDERDIKTGEEVTLIGAQGKEEITLNEFADFCGTINYDIICKLGRRVKRVYVP